MLNKSPKEGKQKLTLSINKEVIENARREGINISAITEEVLKAITFSREKNTRDDLIEAYENFFDVVKPWLQKFGTEIKVGSNYEPNSGSSMPIHFSKDGLSIEDFDGIAHYTYVSDVVESLDGPKEILENLIPALIKAAQNNREKMREFEISLRFLRALSDEKGKKK